MVSNVNRNSSPSLRRANSTEKAEEKQQQKQDQQQLEGAAAEATPERARVDAATARGARARAMSAGAGLAAQLSEAVTGAVSGAMAAAGLSGAETKPLFSSGTIRRGSGDSMAVTDLQQQLNARGAELSVDGDFGPATEAAVQAFQREQGLQPDGIVGPLTRQAFRDTANTTTTGPVDGAGNAPSAGLLRKGAEGPPVEALQTRLNNVISAGLTVDGDFGNRTKAAVEQFQSRAGLDIDGVAGPRTMAALAEVEAGTRELDAAPPPGTGTGPARPNGPASKQVTVDGNTFDVHNMTRRDFGRRSVPGNRIISLDANSVSGRPGEVLRPLIIIPNNATPTERQAAQQAVDRMAQWINDNVPGSRQTTGLVRTTAQNGRGLSGFYHTEFFSVNDTAVTNLVRNRPQEYARILGETLGQIPGANFIVPHGNINSRGIEDPGAVSANGSVSEVGLGRHVIEEGFKRL